MYRFLFIICFNAALGKVLTTQGYPVQQYIHVTGGPPYIPDPLPRQPNQPLVPAPIPKPKPEPTPVPKPTLPPTPTNTPKKDAPGLDSNVLNNLAIALQLLIVSNILNLPPQEGNSEIASKMALAMDPLETPYSPSSFIIESPKYEMGPKYAVESMMSPYIEQAVPNLNFLASNSFGDANIYSPFTPTSKLSPRAEMGFMSPYDALASSSPYSDPILSTSYGSVPSKRDFQSPYAAILSDNKDLFSVFDFY
ncbi:uncharacterized protein LOC115439808 [Manduca sexta]|uniref:uncharacterized protein LOC115439808 n=1 Tax=Manduca sexta TaxID=7130 RepID=UPI00188ED66E|nr:uncharacterized protein LOC115439808 [Manduca sexta]